MKALVTFCQFVSCTYLICVQTVTSHEVKMQDHRHKELRWTALPKPCQKCFGVKRKRIVAENVTLKSKELLDKVINAEHAGGEEFPADPVLCGTSVMPTEDMLLSAGCGLGTKVSKTNDGFVCTAATSSSRSRSQNLNHTSSMKQQNTASDLHNISKAPQLHFVQPLFKNSVTKRVKDVASPCSAVTDVKVRAAGNMKKDLELHRCPLCDMVFDIRQVHYVTCICCIVLRNMPADISVGTLFNVQASSRDQEMLLKLCQRYISK